MRLPPAGWARCCDSSGREGVKRASTNTPARGALFLIYTATGLFGRSLVHQTTAVRASGPGRCVWRAVTDLVDLLPVLCIWQSGRRASGTSGIAEAVCLQALPSSLHPHHDGTLRHHRDGTCSGSHRPVGQPLCPEDIVDRPDRGIDTRLGPTGLSAVTDRKSKPSRYDAVCQAGIAPHHPYDQCGCHRAVRRSWSNWCSLGRGRRHTGNFPLPHSNNLARLRPGPAHAIQACSAWPQQNGLACQRHFAPEQPGVVFFVRRRSLACHGVSDSYPIWPLLLRLDGPCRIAISSVPAECRHLSTAGASRSYPSRKRG
ncbi:Uncharacterised protein [Achromobacter xylosoxidans]|nr:Uncharacterised protein [Achromobacter xylosoxidans]